MKYAIFGDMHGIDLRALEAALGEEDPDSLICLGDFDQTKTIRQFIDIQDYYEALGKRVIVVPGNHDKAILKGESINSGALTKQGKSSYELTKRVTRRFYKKID